MLSIPIVTCSRWIDVHTLRDLLKVVLDILEELVDLIVCWGLVHLLELGVGNVFCGWGVLRLFLRLSRPAQQAIFGFLLFLREGLLFYGNRHWIIRLLN